MRPDVLFGRTYKISNSTFSHSVFITINDIVTEDGVRKPFEIFINSKSPDTFASFTALTRVISAVFRAVDDPGFLIEELTQIFDPRGGYWKSGGRWMASIYSEIAEVIRIHLENLKEQN